MKKATREYPCLKCKKPTPFVEWALVHKCTHCGAVHKRDNVNNPYSLEVKDIAVQVAEFIINDTETIRGMDSCLNELLTDYERAKARESEPEVPPCKVCGAKQLHTRHNRCPGRITKGRKRWV